MSIFGLLDRGRREICYRSRFGEGHLKKGGLYTEASSHDLEPAEELRRQMVVASRVGGR